MDLLLEMLVDYLLSVPLRMLRLALLFIIDAVMLVEGKLLHFRAWLLGVKRG